MTGKTSHEDYDQSTQDTAVCPGWLPTIIKEVGQDPPPYPPPPYPLAPPWVGTVHMGHLVRHPSKDGAHRLRGGLMWALLPLCPTWWSRLTPLQTMTARSLMVRFCAQRHLAVVWDATQMGVLLLPPCSLKFWGLFLIFFILPSWDYASSVFIMWQRIHGEWSPHQLLLVCASETRFELWLYKLNAFICLRKTTRLHQNPRRCISAQDGFFFFCTGLLFLLRSVLIGVMILVFPGEMFCGMYPVT